MEGKLDSGKNSGNRAGLMKTDTRQVCRKILGQWRKQEGKQKTRKML